MVSARGGGVLGSFSVEPDGSVRGKFVVPKKGGGEGVCGSVCVVCVCCLAV